MLQSTYAKYVKISRADVYLVDLNNYVRCHEKGTTKVSGKSQNTMARAKTWYGESGREPGWRERKRKGCRRKA